MLIRIGGITIEFKGDFDMSFERKAQVHSVLISSTLGTSHEVDYSEISAAALCFPVAQLGDTISIYVKDFEQDAFKDSGYSVVASAYVQLPNELFPASSIKFVTNGSDVTVTMHAKS